MLTVGLTGTTGSGKGYVSKLLCDNDIFVIDTDKIYHKMISSPSPCVDALVSEFGSSVLNQTGGIDRAKLAEIVFSDKNMLEALNRITHSMIIAKTKDIIEQTDGKHIALVDAPLLFESGFDKECDIIIGVVASPDIRIERIMQRDSISLDRACARISNQKSDSYFRENCDIIIENEGGDILEKIKSVKEMLINLYEEKKKEE